MIEKEVYLNGNTRLDVGDHKIYHNYVWVATLVDHGKIRAIENRYVGKLYNPEGFVVNTRYRKTIAEVVRDVNDIFSSGELSGLVKTDIHRLQ